VTKKSTPASTATSILLLGFFVFLIWEMFQTLGRTHEAGWQELLRIFTLFFIGILMLSPKKNMFFALPLLLHEIGAMLGGLASGYSFTGFKIGRYRLARIKGRFTMEKYPESYVLASCTMSPPDTEPEKCPYRLHLMGGVILMFVFSFVELFLYYLFDRHALAFIFCFWPAVASLLLALPLLSPTNNNGLATPAYRAFLSFPKNPSFRSANYYAEKCMSLLYESDSIAEIPNQLMELVIQHDYSNLGDPSVASLYDVKARFHCYRNEFEEERLCYETVYNSPDVAVMFRTITGMSLLFDELTGACRNAVIEKYYDKAAQEYLDKHSKSPSTRRNMYAYHLLYKNDPAAAQKEYDEFLKIIAVYPGKIDVENEWGAIHKIQECRERITASTLV